jgi:hypothetical protein
MVVARQTAHLGLLANYFLCILATSLNVLFGFFKFADALNIIFYYRYSPRVINIVVFSNSIDFRIWIFTFVLIVLEMFLVKTKFNPSIPRWAALQCFFSIASFAVFLVNDTLAYFIAVPLGFITVGLLIYYGNGYHFSSREEAASLTSICIAGLLILFEVASVSSWVFNIFSYETPFRPTARWIFPQIDLQLFNLLYPLTSWLFLLFLYSWIWIPAMKEILSRASVSTRIHSRIDKHIVSPIQNAGSRRKLNNKYVALGLLLVLATAAFIAYYPITHAPNSTLVGVDATAYYDWLKEMAQQGPLVALDRDRPFFNLLMYSVQKVTGSPPETIVIALPVILAVCLSLVVFWFVRVGTKNELVALMASLFSSFSFQMTVGVFAYFAANWLAIIESFLLLIFMLKSFEKHSWKYVLASALIGIILLLTYPYMWDVVMVILVFYLTWMFVKRKPDKKMETVFLAFVLASNAVFYVAYSLAPFGGGVSTAVRAGDVTSSISVSNFFNLQNGLASMVQAWVGGLLGNPLLLILAVAGVFSMFDLKKDFNRIMLLWTMIPSLALLVVAPDPYYYRFIYLIPFQVQAAAGLYWTVTKLEDMRGRFKMSETSRTAITMAVVLVVLFLLNCALRSVDEATIQIIPR